MKAEEREERLSVELTQLSLPLPLKTLMRYRHELNAGSH